MTNLKKSEKKPPHIEAWYPGYRLVLAGMLAIDVIFLQIILQQNKTNFFDTLALIFLCYAIPSCGALVIAYDRLIKVTEKTIPYETIAKHFEYLATSSVLCTGAGIALVLINANIFAGIAFAVSYIKAFGKITKIKEIF